MWSMGRNHLFQIQKLVVHDMLVINQNHLFQIQKLAVHDMLVINRNHLFQIQKLAVHDMQGINRNHLFQILKDIRWLVLMDRTYYCLMAPDTDLVVSLDLDSTMSRQAYFELAF